MLGQLDVRERARPWLTWLVKETGETATLSLPGGELVAILGLQGPAARLPAATRRDLRDPLLRAAREVSQSLGGPG